MPEVAREPLEVFVLDDDPVVAAAIRRAFEAIVGRFAGRNGHYGFSRHEFCVQCNGMSEYDKELQSNTEEYDEAIEPLDGEEDEEEDEEEESE